MDKETKLKEKGTKDFGCIRDVGRKCGVWVSDVGDTRAWI
jgi:hypothetical protein